MMFWAAFFMTGIWAVPPAMSRVPESPLNSSRGSARADAAERERVSRAAVNSFFIMVFILKAPSVQRFSEYVHDPRISRMNRGWRTLEASATCSASGARRTGLRTNAGEPGSVGSALAGDGAKAPAGRVEAPARLAGVMRRRGGGTERRGPTATGTDSGDSNMHPVHLRRSRPVMQSRPLKKPPHS